VKRGADVASDHHLVTASVKLKLKRNENKKQATRVKYRVHLLKEQTKAKEFQLTLTNKYQVLQNLLDTG